MAVIKWLLMYWTNPLLCSVQHFELEFVHNERYDYLQYHQHHNEETNEIEPNQPTGSRQLSGKSLLISAVISSLDSITIILFTFAPYHNNVPVVNHHQYKEGHYMCKMGKASNSHYSKECNFYHSFSQYRRSWGCSRRLMLKGYCL